MNFNSKQLFIAFVTLGLGACASVSELQEKVAARDSCCTSMSEFKYEALGPSTPIPFALNEQSPVFSFETGKSYFKAFSLSFNAQQKTLRVSSHPTGSIAFETRQFSQSFCARALFLDDAFKQLGASDNIPDFARGFWSSAFVSQFDIPANTRYVILLTNPQTFTSSAVRYTGGGGYMVGKTFVFERGGEPIYHPCGPVADAVAEIL
jgi:hypothetical protein